MELQIGCLEVLRELSNYIDHDVSPELRSQIESHVQECHSCRAVFDGMSNIVRLVGSADVIELPLGFSRRLFEKVHARIVC
ncbi:MAG TPA: zf-HC2 domain-containing protein [Terriglobales bacterium]|nr:zf-HC2 domain-containing protein [Terriglobales bacterium]